MSFDNSRFTFNPLKDYSGVVMQQGRVQLDSEWNEWLAEINRRTQAGTLDTLGRVVNAGTPPATAVYPATTPYAFQITVAAGANPDLLIGPGRMYVDGILVENHGDPASAGWDPALAEISNAPQPPLAAPLLPNPPKGAVSYYNSDPTKPQQPHPPTNGLPAAQGSPYLAYLDVWTRPVTWLEDSDLIDKAVNVDTAGRLQTVWQVKLMPVPGGTTCNALNNWPPARSAGLLSSQPATLGSPGPCCVNDASGYTGLENQFYRVEIHKPGTPVAAVPAQPFTYPLPNGTATFKWSRDNASVMTGVTAITAGTNSAGDPADVLTVLSLGRDQVLGFAPGNWIEILDDGVEFQGVPFGTPGQLCQIDTVDPASLTITLTGKLTSSFPKPTATHTRIVRWDQAGPVYMTDGKKLGNVWVDTGGNNSTGDIPVPPAGTMLVLENGVTVSFDLSTAGGQFMTADFWTFAARTDGSIEELIDAPPRGIHHHYAPLSVLDLNSGNASDCRIEWPPDSSGQCGCCCTRTVGDGVNSFGEYTSIQAAINSLTGGGEICILPGRYFEAISLRGVEDIVIHGCGAQTRLASPSLSKAGPARKKAAANQFSAVISVSYAQNIQLRDFVVEAADGDVGILLDGTGNLVVGDDAAVPKSFASRKKLILEANPYVEPPPVSKITIEDLYLTASTAPAIMAEEIQFASVRNCSIAVANVYSPFGAVRLSGGQIDFVSNWVGIESILNLSERFPTVVYNDLLADAGPGGLPLLTGQLAVHPGGIQIASPADNIRIAQNTVENGCRNGITLGSFTILDANNVDTGIVAGLTFAQPAVGSPANALLSPTTYPGVDGSKVVAGEPLSGISIERNTITQTGLCGIGPVGFFDLGNVLEVIALEDLTIAGNTIRDTVLAATVPEPLADTKGYGAISLPTVENLIVRGNSLTSFGALPGLKVSGIFLLHAEMAELSGNDIVDRRDWSTEQAEKAGDPKDRVAAIQIEVVTPPTLDNVATIASLLLYVPGLPALRIEANEVRVPRGLALSAVGFGPFAISGNHFSCGGNQTNNWQVALGEQCVSILNMGAGIDLFIPLLRFSNLYANANDPNFNATQLLPSILSTSGAVTFTNNRCQLELAKAHQVSLASVLILTLDHLTFSNNHCWLDTGLIGSFVLANIFLLADSLQVTGNRLQEGLLSVYLSGLTIGFFNVTSQNISTYCLDALGKFVRSSDNLMLFQPPDEAYCMRRIGK